jgi:hypothetical protein
VASIADLLGVQWSGDQGSDGGYRLHPHAARQAQAKGFHPDRVLQAANDPHHTYPNGRYPGQKRHVRDGIVAVVDPGKNEVVTVYEDQRETAPRDDQTDRDAQRYARRYRSGGAR